MENKTKRVPKGEINYKIPLSPEQRLAKAGVFEKDVSIIMGDAASGKTFWACHIAYDLFATRKIERIIIARPIVANKLGFLPGLASEKMAPWIYPMRDNFYQLLGNRVQVDKMFEEGIIEILPLDFTKGVTYRDACVIIDEAQDMDYEDFRMCLTRLGINSKLLFIGSQQQVSIKNSCVSQMLKLQNSDLVNYHTFKSNHRNPIIFEILKHLEHVSNT